MPSILRFGGLRVVVYPNDHRPAHVHVIGHGHEAVFNLNCPEGPAELRENYGFRARTLRESNGNWVVNWRNFAKHGREFMVWREQVELANRRAQEVQASFPRAVSAHFDRASGRVVIELSSKLAVSFKPHDAQGLERAKPEDLADIEISPSGLGLHFPRLDADLHVPGLLEGFLGSRKWMASTLGQVGGQSRSQLKKAAARANGRLGGRPRKKRQVGNR